MAPVPGSPLVAVGQLLSPLTLTTVTTGQPLTWPRPADGSVIVVFPHPAPCGGCDIYLLALGERTSEYRGWGAHPLAVLAPGDDRGDLARELPFPVLADPVGTARLRYGVAEDPVVVVADRWGLVYGVTSAPRHDFPRPEGEILDEVVLLGIQCPECDVADVPTIDGLTPAPLCGLPRSQLQSQPPPP